MEESNMSWFGEVLKGNGSYVLIVSNMRTAEDARKIEQGLRSIDGMIKAEAIVRIRRVAVEFDTGKTNLETLLKKVEELGYTYIRRV
jgi:copper chaperone CopZ